MTGEYANVLRYVYANVLRNVYANALYTLHNVLRVIGLQIIIGAPKFILLLLLLLLLLLRSTAIRNACRRTHGVRICDASRYQLKDTKQTGEKRTKCQQNQCTTAAVSER